MYAVGFFEMFVHLNHQTKERQLHEDGNLDIQRHWKVQPRDKTIYEFKFTCTH